MAVVTPRENRELEPKSVIEVVSNVRSSVPIVRIRQLRLWLRRFCSGMNDFNVIVSGAAAIGKRANQSQETSLDLTSSRNGKIFKSGKNAHFLEVLQRVLGKMEKKIGRFKTWQIQIG